jgi:hypothetical protein
MSCRSQRFLNSPARPPPLNLSSSQTEFRCFYRLRMAGRLGDDSGCRAPPLPSGRTLASPRSRPCQLAVPRRQSRRIWGTAIFPSTSAGAAPEADCFAVGIDRLCLIGNCNGQFAGTARYPALHPYMTLAWLGLRYSRLEKRHEIRIASDPKPMSNPKDPRNDG